MISTSDQEKKGFALAVLDDPEQLMMHAQGAQDVRRLLPFVALECRPPPCVCLEVYILLTEVDM